MDRFDRYVARSMFGAYAAALVFLSALFVLINLLLDLNGFLVEGERRGAGTFELLGDMLRYYALFLPIVFLTVGPFVSVIAGMFAVSRHVAANELVPMLFTGRSTVRLLRPVLAVGILSALGMGVVWEFVVPAVTEPLFLARRVLDGKSADVAMQDLVVRVRTPTDRTLIIGDYDHASYRMERVSLVDRGSGAQDLALTLARMADWDADRGDWRLTDGTHQAERRATPMDWLGLPEVQPDLLWRLGKEGRDTVQLSYSELLDLRALRPARTDFVLALHNHVTFPLANFLLLLLALPFAVHFERGSRTERVVFAVLLCAAYLVADLTCQNLGRSMLHPVLAAWLPTILFGSVGVVFFGGIRT